MQIPKQSRPLYITAVDYTKKGVIDSIHAKFSFDDTGMIFSRSEMLYLLESANQTFYIDERSFSFQVKKSRNGSLNATGENRDDLGKLITIEKLLGKISKNDKLSLQEKGTKYLKNLFM